jgi:hypothetical protein
MRVALPTIKVVAAFIVGVITASGFAIANTSPVPVVKACVDNKSKALYIANNGSCPKGEVLSILEQLVQMLRASLS